MRRTPDHHTAAKVHIYFTNDSFVFFSHPHSLFDMSTKRGRPLSGESDNVAVNRRREQVRERMRKLRQRQQGPHAGTVTPAQQAQEERIVSLPSIEEHQAAETLLALGVRSSAHVQLPDDRLDARLQQQATDVDEHEQLYSNSDTIENHEDENTAQPVRSFFYHFTLPKRQRVEVDNPDRSIRPSPTPTPTATEGRDPRSLSVSQPCDAIESPANASAASNEHFDNTDLYADQTDEYDDLGWTGDSSPEAEAPEDHFTDTEHSPAEYHDRGLEGDVINLSLGSEDLLGAEELHMDPDHDDDDPGLVVEHDGDTESAVSFLSEREVDEEKERAGEYTANKLFEQIQGGHHGCTEEQHEEKRRQHMAEAGNNHYGLGQIFKDRRFPSVLGLEGLLTPEQLAEQPQPTAVQWEAMFCGVPPRGSQRCPKNVCLHKEETRAAEPQVAFDVDSFLGFWSSLAAAKQGIVHQPASISRQNLQTDVHLEMNTFTPGDEGDDAIRSAQRMLKDVPHFLLGRVYGATHITVHILFPHLPLAPGRDRFISMTQAQLTRWTDKVFNPAFYKYYPAYHTQHLTASYRHAWRASKAHQVEGRKIDTSSYQSQQSLMYHLRPDYLQQVWDTILETINTTPGMADFREPQIFFTAKGTKMSFQTLPSKPTLLDAIEHFESDLEPVLDMRYVETDRFYVDLGKEICAPVSLLPGQGAHHEEEAQVYSWKRCCLEEYMQWAYDGQPPSNKAEGQRYYHQNMLYDASSLTSVTPKLSQLRKGGLIYSQFYGSVKEITDAAKCMPFDNDGIEDMALDPQIRKGAQSIAGGHRRQTRIITQAYLDSKGRARDAIQDSRRKSFGIREEHRMTWALLQRLKVLLQARDRETLEVILSDCPPYAWPVRTDVYLDFLWRSADKFATGFEVVRARCGRDIVTWEQTKIMFAFLRCLRFVFGGHQLRQEGGLWWSKRTLGEGTAAQRIWYGLGFCNTLPRYKYSWMEPRMDWERVQFQAAISDRVVFGNGALRGQYLRRGKQVRGFVDSMLTLEMALSWLERYRGHPMICERLISWLVHLCLQQFRVDILQAVQAEIKEAHRDEAVTGNRPFSRDYFQEIMQDGCFLMRGNKTELKTPELVAHFLFDYGDRRERKHWEDRPFRKLYERAFSGIATRVPERRASFSSRLWQYLFDFHWVLPYPCYNSLLQNAKVTQRRMWYSIARDDDSKKWIWAKDKWRGGQPSALPPYTQWSREEWERWLEERGGPPSDV